MIEYTNLFSSNNFEKNDEIILLTILWTILNTYKMESYCLKCRKNTENIDPKVSASSNGRVMILSKCAIFGSKNPDLLKIKKQKDH